MSAWIAGLKVIYLVSFANLALKKHTIMYFGRIYLMERMGFGGNWRGSMRACISSPFFSLSERSPYGCFSKSRGLPQGDLLSPTLFWWWRFWVGLLRTGEGGFILGFRVGYTADLGLCLSLIYYLLMMQSFYFIFFLKNNVMIILNKFYILEWCWLFLKLWQGLR